jgi:hypothetical protein
MKDQPLNYKLPLQPTRRQEARNGLVSRNRNLFGSLPGKQTPFGDFLSNVGIGDKLAMEEKREFGG